MGSSTVAQMFPPSQVQPSTQYSGLPGYSTTYQSATLPTLNALVPSYGQALSSTQSQAPGHHQPQQQPDSLSNGLKRSSDEVDIYSKRPRPDSAGGVALYPQRPGEKFCAFYMTTRTCSFGVTCRFDHPPWVPFGGIPNWKEVTASGTGLAPTDPISLPQRLGEPNCSFYMKTGECKFGSRCRFNHPTERRTGSADSAGSSKDEGLKGTINGALKGDTGVSSGISIAGIERNTGISAITSGAAMMKTRPLGEKTIAKQALLNSKGLPMRPGENECMFYMKTGSCKFGATCRYNHPETSKPGTDYEYIMSGAERRTGLQVAPQNQVSNFGAPVSYAAGTFSSQAQTPNLGTQLTYVPGDTKVNDTQAVGTAYYQQWQTQPVTNERKVIELAGASQPSYQWQMPSAAAAAAETIANGSSALTSTAYLQHWTYPSSMQPEYKVGDSASSLSSQYQQQWQCLPVQADSRVVEPSAHVTATVQQPWQSMPVSLTVPVQVPVQAVTYADATTSLAASQYQQQWTCPPVQSESRVPESTSVAAVTPSPYTQQTACPVPQASYTTSAGQVAGTTYEWQYLPSQSSVAVGEGTPQVMSSYQQQWTYMPDQTPVKDALSPGTSGMPVSCYPQRPGDPDCAFYLKTGECSFGASCKFHHPPGRVPSGPPKVAAKLTLAGLPRREGESMCAYYVKTGACKYGSTCRFDHPPPGEVAARLASAEPLKFENLESDANDLPDILETKQPITLMQYVDLNLPSKPDDVLH